MACGQAAQLTIPVAPSPSLYEQASKMSCTAMSELAKKELGTFNNSLVYSVQDPTCGALATYRDWQAEYTLLAGPSMMRKKDMCVDDSVYKGLPEWKQKSVPAHPFFQENTSRKGKSRM